MPFKATPRNVTFRGIEDFTTPVPRTITIKRGDGGPLQLEVAHSGRSGIEVELQEIKAGEHYELLVGLSPPQRPGKLRSAVRLKTGIKEAPEASILVYAEIPRGWAESELRSAAR